MSFPRDKVVPISSRGGTLEQDARKRAIEAALQTYAESNSNRTETIEYRGQLKSFEVIRINSSVPLLSHNNSRLRAQISTHPLKDQIQKSPFTSESQEVLAALLAQTEKFEDLRRQLKDLGQRHPGIITRDGLLVNGNTRLVATKANGEEGFDVAVLPADATSDDFFQIEMKLQLVNYVHQDYTFTNRLLLVQDLVNREKNESAVLKYMGWERLGKQKLAIHQRLLALVEEIRSISDPKLDYPFFDSKEEMLKNLDAAFQSALEESPRDADQLKWTRITAMILGLNKDEVRAIDMDFVETSLQPRIEGGEVEDFLSEHRAVETHDDLDEILDPQRIERPAGYNMRGVARDIISKTISSGGVISPERLDGFSKLHNAIKTGARDNIEAEVAQKMRSEPIEYLKEVTLKVEELTNSLPALFKDAEFNQAKFEFQAKKTQKSIQALQSELDRQLGTS